MRPTHSLLISISLTVLLAQAFSLEPHITSRSEIRDHVTSKALSPKNVKLGVNIVDITITTTHKQDLTNSTRVQERKDKQEPSGKPIRIIRNPKSKSSTAKTGERKHKSAPTQRKHFEIPLLQSKKNRLFFTTTVLLGPKKYPYNFLIITDSALSLIKDEDCKKIEELAPVCKNKIGSAEFAWNSSTKYVGEVVQGDLWLDKTHISKDNYFLLIDKKSEHVNIDYPFLGLGFADGKYTSFLQHLKNQDLIDELAFSFYFNLQVSEYPILYLGSLNMEQLDLGKDFAVVEMTVQNEYMGLIDNLLANDQQLFPKGSKMLTKFDSGESMISLPMLFIEPILDLIQKTLYTKCKISDTKPSTFSCKLKNFNTLPKLSFVIDGLKFALLGKDYINSCTNPTPSDAFYDCDFLIQFEDHSLHGYYITLGQTFMRKFYTSFYLDAKKIFVGHYQNEQKANNQNNEKPDKKFPMTEKGHHKEVLESLFADQ